MKIIIAGGTGLIGGALAENLARDGHEVIVLSRGAKPDISAPPNIRLVKWDGRSTQDWGHLVDGADAIVNLAGKNLSSGRWTPRNKQEVLESRINAGSALVQAIQQVQRRPAVLVQSSAVGYYGFSDSTVFSEEARPGWRLHGNGRPGMGSQHATRRGAWGAPGGGAFGRDLEHPLGRLAAHAARLSSSSWAAGWGLAASGCHGCTWKMRCAPCVS